MRKSASAHLHGRGASPARLNLPRPELYRRATTDALPTKISLDGPTARGPASAMVSISASRLRLSVATTEPKEAPTGSTSAKMPQRVSHGVGVATGSAVLQTEHNLANHSAAPANQDTSSGEHGMTAMERLMARTNSAIIPARHAVQTTNTRSSSTEKRNVSTGRRRAKLSPPSPVNRGGSGVSPRNSLGERLPTPSSPVKHKVSQARAEWTPAPAVSAADVEVIESNSQIEVVVMHTRTIGITLKTKKT